jgi:hypothetical protein
MFVALVWKNLADKKSNYIYAEKVFDDPEVFGVNLLTLSCKLHLFIKNAMNIACVYKMV